MPQQIDVDLTVSSRPPALRPQPLQSRQAKCRPLHLPCTAQPAVPYPDPLEPRAGRTRDLLLCTRWPAVSAAGGQGPVQGPRRRARQIPWPTASKSPGISTARKHVIHTYYAMPNSSMATMSGLRLREWCTTECAAHGACQAPIVVIIRRACRSPMTAI